MVKGYVKNKVKHAAIKAIDNAIKNSRSERISIKDAGGKEYVLFASDKEKYSLKDLDKDLKIINKFFKTFNPHNAMQLYRNIDYISRNKDNKFFSAKGKYNVNLVYRNIVEHAKIKGTNGFYIDKSTVDRVLNDLEIKAENQYDIMLGKIQKSLENGYIKYDKESKMYTITAKGDEKLELNQRINGIKNDDFTIVLKYINENGGSLSTQELKEKLKKDNIETVKKYCEDLYLNGYLERIGCNGEHSDRYYNIKYTVTEKAKKSNFNNLPLEEFYKLYKLNMFDKIIFEVSQKNQGTFTMYELRQKSKNLFKEIYGSTKKAKKSYEIFLEYSSFRVDSMSKAGLLNYRFEKGIEYYQATNYFYKTLEKQNMLQELDIKSPDDNFKMSNLHKHVVKLTDENGLNINELLSKYKKDSEVINPKDKIKKIKNACEKLVVNGYMEYDEEKDCYRVTNKALEYMKNEKSFSLNFGDVKIFEMIDEADGAITTESLKEKFHNDAADKFYDKISNIDMFEINNIINKNKYFSNTDFSKKILSHIKTSEGITYKDLYNKVKNSINIDYRRDNDEKSEKKEEEIYCNFLNMLASENLIEVKGGKYYLSTKGHDYIRPDELLNMTLGRLSTLIAEGYIKETEAGYIRTEKSDRAIYLFREVDALEKAIYDFSVINNGNINKEEFIKNIYEDKKLLTEVQKIISAEKSEKKEYKFSKYDANVIFKEFKDNVLAEEQLKGSLSERYDDSKEAEKQYNIMLGRIKKNVEHGYLDYDKDTKIYRINEKGEKEAKIVASQFEFTDYDLNVVFGYINKNAKNLSVVDLKEQLKSEYKNEEYIEKQLSYLIKRMNNNVEEGYLGKDETGRYLISDKGLKIQSERDEMLGEYIEKKFKILMQNRMLADKDDSIKTTEIFGKLVDRKLNINDIILFNAVKDKEQFSLSDIKEGSDSLYIYMYGKTKIAEDKYKEFMEYVEKRIKSLENAGLIIEKENGLLSFHDSFMTRLEGKKLDYKAVRKPDESFEIKKFHYGILKDTERMNGLKIDNLVEQYKADDRIEDPEKKIQIVQKTCEKLAINGYLNYINGEYMLTDKAYEHLNNNRLKIGWADVKIYRMIDKSEDNLTIENIKSKLKDEKEQGIIIGRLKKLEAEGYVKYENKGYQKTGQGEEKVAEFIKQKDEEKKQKHQPNVDAGKLEIIEKHLEKSSDDKKSKDFSIGDYCGKQNKKSSLENFKLQNWDKKNIIDKSENNIWSEEIFTKKSQDLDKELLQKRIATIQKRLFTLETMGLAEHIEDGKFYLKDSLYERISLLKEKGINKFSAEQKETIKELAQFLNLTDRQMESFIYKENSIIFKSDLNYLLNKGYIEEYKRDLKNDGNFEKIYYLTTDGKKAASHLTGVKTDKIFSSKVKGRPQELRHDLLIYTAYKDLEEKLEEEGYRILNTMTDKQMKSKDMIEKGKQRIEYSDLYVEIEKIDTGEKSHINIEVDCGYKPGVIKSKAENIDNLVWYTDSVKQYKTLNNTLKDASVVLISL